jgi:outer membrane murein-binding lipoprotein Lpp
MPSLLDIQMLSERVAQLESQVQALQGPTSKASPAAKKPAAKASRPAAKPATASRKKSA